MNGLNSLLTSSAVGQLSNVGSLSAPQKGGETGFSDVLSDIYGLAGSAENKDKGSVLSLLSGDVNDISDVLIDSEKSKIALSLTIEVRNKILEAYNQMMNMQV